jgi:Tol biopolymer transport system component
VAAGAVATFHGPHDGLGQGSLSWSPDSTRVAFVEDARDAPDPHVGVADVRTGWLRVLDRKLGAAAERLLPRGPEWSPDGRELALVHDGAPVLTVAADGSTLRKLPVIATTATWLHDGRLIVATGVNGDRLTILSAHGAAETIARLPDGELVASLLEAR